MYYLCRYKVILNFFFRYYRFQVFLEFYPSLYSISNFLMSLMSSHPKSIWYSFNPNRILTPHHTHYYFPPQLQIITLISKSGSIHLHIIPLISIPTQHHSLNFHPNFSTTQHYYPNLPQYDFHNLQAKLTTLILQVFSPILTSYNSANFYFNAYANSQYSLNLRPNTIQFSEFPANTTSHPISHSNPLQPCTIH